MSQPHFSLKRVPNQMPTMMSCNHLWTNEDWSRNRDHLVLRDEEYFPEEDNRVLCKNCAVKAVREYNHYFRPHFYTSFDLGELGSWDAVQAKLEELWDRRYFNNYLKVVRPEPDARDEYGIGVFTRKQVGDYLHRCGEYPKFRLMVSLDYPYDTGHSPTHIVEYLRKVGPKWNAFVFPMLEGQSWRPQQIFVSLSMSYGLIDPDSGKVREFGPGVYELERVLNPYGHKIPWLVIKGTRIGMAETGWNIRRPGMLEMDPESPKFAQELTRTDLDLYVQYTGSTSTFAFISDANLEDQRPGVAKAIE
jgi:hypothetical protein